MGQPLSIYGIGDSILSPDSPFNCGVDPFAELVLPMIDIETKWVNNSWPGRSTENLKSFIETFSRDIELQDTLFIFQLGTNDFNVFGRGLAGYSEISASVSHLKLRGAKTAVCTLLPRDDQYLAGGGWVQSQADQFAAYNTLVRRERAGADYIVDLAADAAMGDSNALDDIDLYADRLHPTLSGWRFLSSHFANLVNRIS